MDSVSIELMQLRGLNESSTRENNPYFTVAHSLSRLLRLHDSEAWQDQVVMIAGHVYNDFGTCLENKGPVAFLLLCFGTLEPVQVNVG